MFLSHPYGVTSQVRYLVVSILDLCLFSLLLNICYRFRELVSRLLDEAPLFRERNFLLLKVNGWKQIVLIKEVASFSFV